MDAPPDPLRLSLQEGPSGGPNSPVSPGTLGEPDTSEPLITAQPRCASVSAIASANASAIEVPRRHARPLHVQFDAQRSAAPEMRPPDGGWGWVIVFAAFMVHFTAGGITVSFGMLFPHFLEYFGEGRGITAWIASIFMAMPLLSGPIASFLTDRYGCRRTTICGSILAAIGFVISAFVYNVETLFLTFGIMAGFGLSLCCVAPIVIVAYYFEKKRSLATGISVCGNRIGQYIVFDLLAYVLLDKYEWRETTLILAGLCLNMAVCGLFFRDLPWTDTMNEERIKERKRRRERNRNKSFGSTVNSLTDSKSSVVGPSKATDAIYIEADTISIVPQHSSLVDLATHKTGGEGVSLEKFELMSTHNSVPSAPDTNGTRQFNDKAALSVHWYAGLRDFWDWVLDFSHFRNPAFLVFAVSNFLLYMWCLVPHVYILDISINMDLGMSQVSIILILNIFGEIILGWVGDWECVNPSLVYAVCMVFCGLATFAMPLLTSYLGLAAASGAYGAFISANYSLTSIILVEQITLEKFTNAYGLLLLMQGLANLIGPPLAGWVVDITNSYDLSFYLAGVFIAISGLILLVSPAYNATLRYNNYRKRKSADTSANISANLSANITADLPDKSANNEQTHVNGKLKQNGKLIM